ncbi:MAG: imidazoleglycerol-phosphate dehydratase HisB [Syntrophomonadaceae bacterium]|jgi:imidazoleglycerol-phosphate dehydratase|nr:imidazoleglycerol-phosphate dehydratase HisB [Syntrophomonadaceae bacterium]
MNDIRKSEIIRKTSETEITLSLNIDGNGVGDIDSGIPFLDHMLHLLAVHSLCDLELKARGDLRVDDHHTVEDIGICLGEALKQAIADKERIHRYGAAAIPMDEALAQAVLDFSGRPYFVYKVQIGKEQVGGLAVESVPEFFQALVNHAGINLHIELIRGENAHHCIEAIFKAFAHALREAAAFEPRIKGVWSSKGTLA